MTNISIVKLVVLPGSSPRRDVIGNRFSHFSRFTYTFIDLSDGVSDWLLVIIFDDVYFAMIKAGVNVNSFIEAELVVG